MHCLLVEDDKLILTLLQGFLARLGHEVTAVTFGEAAWEAFSASRFPAVICDWDMPEMSGIQLCQKIRAMKGAQYPAERILEFQGQIGILKDLLPICMYCKKIRGDKHYWETVEAYFKEQMGADFTHSLCPDCYEEKIRPQLDSLRKETADTKSDRK